MKLFKIIAVWLTLFHFAFANNIVQKVQDQFITDVLIFSAYKDRFYNYFESQCGDNAQCICDKIKILKQWESVQNDIKLQNLLTKQLAFATIDNEYFERLKTKLSATKLDLQSSQFLSVVDLETQNFILLFWDNELKEFHFIGRDLISSGNVEREIEIQPGEDHFLETPSGVFQAQKGWRSHGKAHKNDSRILGYGKEDRFIFYFGEHITIRYNVFDKEKNKIPNKEDWQLIKDTLKFAMHSHESPMKMGAPNSHGCIRMDDELNRFLDNNFVLHKPIIKNNQWNHNYSPPPKSPQNIHFAGEYLVIFDKL